MCDLQMGVFSFVTNPQWAWVDGVKYAKEYADAMVNKITLGRSSGKPEELPQTTPEVDPNRVKMRLYHGGFQYACVLRGNCHVKRPLTASRPRRCRNSTRHSEDLSENDQILKR